MSSEITLKEAAEILLYESSCRKTRMYNLSCCHNCKYCGIVDHDEKKVQAAYEKAIEVLVLRSVLDEKIEGATYEKILNKAFSSDPNEAFEYSVKLARHGGVPEDKILKSVEEIDKFFLGE